MTEPAVDEALVWVFRGIVADYAWSFQSEPLGNDMSLETLVMILGHESVQTFIDTEILVWGEEAQDAVSVFLAIEVLSHTSFTLKTFLFHHGSADSKSGMVTCGVMICVARMFSHAAKMPKTTECMLLCTLLKTWCFFDRRHFFRTFLVPDVVVASVLHGSK